MVLSFTIFIVVPKYFGHNKMSINKKLQYLREVYGQ